MWRNPIQALRIWYSFQSYNAASRQEWVKAAENEFSTIDLHYELGCLQVKLEEDVERTYGFEIGRRTAALAEVRGTLSDLESKFAYFSPNYQVELDRAYGRLNEIKAGQERCRERLKEAYSDLEAAKDGIDSWYAKSDRNRLLLGNRGKRLPNHSMFGQSFGDLDSLKSRRDSAGAAIGEHKSERERLNAEFGELRQRIDRLKSDRAVFLRLQQQGHCRESLADAIQKTRQEMAELEAKIAKLRDSKDHYVTTEVRSRGIVDLQGRIAGVKANREQLIKQFDDPGAIQLRKAAHRQEWLAAHQRTSQAG